MRSNKTVYAISVEDVQDIANDLLDRQLTKKEIALIENSIGDYIDWSQAIENAIRKDVHC